MAGDVEVEVHPPEHEAGEHRESGVSERLEDHGASIARIEAEYKAEISRLEGEIREARSAAISAPAPDLSPLEERITSMESQLQKTEEALEEVAHEPEEPPEHQEPETPPKRLHPLHRKVFG